MFNNKKSEKYLRHHNILKDDEEYISEIPITFSYAFSTTAGYRNARILAIVCIIFGLLFTPIGFITWLCASMTIAIAIGFIILIIGLALLAKATFILVHTPRQINHFITSKRLYFNTNIHHYTYEHVEISELQKVEVQMQPYVTLLAESVDEREYFLCFIRKDGQSVKMEVDTNFITDEQFYNIFPNPNIIRERVLPNKLSTDTSRSRRRRDRDDYYDDNEYNDYDDDYDNGYDEDEYENNY